VVGAVEAQKANTLHVHFKYFIQRAHQFMTLAQIAALLQDGLLHNLYFKKKQNLSNDEYPDLAAWDTARADIEAAMPTFDKEKRLSQLPEFVMQDSGPDIYDCGEAVTTEQLLAEGAEYTKLFLDEVQYVETRTQHHLHRLDAKRCAAARRGRRNAKDSFRAIRHWMAQAEASCYARVSPTLAA